MGQMRDSDWSREILLRSDWLGPSVALYTTNCYCQTKIFAELVQVFVFLQPLCLVFQGQ